MNFGTLVLNTESGVYSNYCSLDSGRGEVFFLRVGKFLFQRPDTGLLVLEIEDKLFQEKAKDVFLLNSANLVFFQRHLQSLYQEKRKAEEEKISQFREKIKAHNDKNNTLLKEVDDLIKKNESFFMENRHQQVKGLKKAIHRGEKAILGFEQKISDCQTQLRIFTEAEVMSMEYVQEKILPLFAQ